MCESSSKRNSQVLPGSFGLQSPSGTGGHLFWRFGTHRSGIRLEVRDAESPRKKTPPVSQGFLVVRFAAASAVASSVVHAQQDGFSAGRRRLQARRHLAPHPRINARVVDSTDLLRSDAPRPARNWPSSVSWECRGPGSIPPRSVFAGKWVAGDQETSARFIGLQFRLAIDIPGRRGKLRASG